MSIPKTQTIVSGIELEKNDAVHVEDGSLSTISSRMDAPAQTNLTAKQQYQQLWTAIKADSRYCWWALYCMLLVFGWGYVNAITHMLMTHTDLPTLQLRRRSLRRGNRLS